MSNNDQAAKVLIVDDVQLNLDLMKDILSQQGYLIATAINGKSAIAKVLENELGIKFGETTQDKKFTLEYANCIGLCDQGPALLVNDDCHTKVTPHKVVEILKKYK